MRSIRKISRKYYVRQIIACWMVSLILFGMMPLQVARAGVDSGQLPQGWEVVAGSVGDFDYSNANQLYIRNITNGTIIKWDGGFNIGADALAAFEFINAGGAVLNRDLTGSLSQIAGQLTANGRVFIVNPAGVIFASGSSVNAVQLVASSLDIKDEDFFAGNYNFQGAALGEIINHGTILADQGVALIGRKVLNTGIIKTKKGGFVVMTAGDKVLLGQPGSRILIEMSSVSSDLAGSGDVINQGQIDADGGTIVLASGDLFSMATELDSVPAKIKTGIGRVVQDGDISVGSGSITLTAADAVTLSEGSLTSANAGLNGDGGDVVVFSGGMTDFQAGAMLQAKGGSESGNGGFAEISGKNFMFAGDLDLSADYGQAGSLLIDPLHLTIADGFGTAT